MKFLFIKDYKDNQMNWNRKHVKYKLKTEKTRLIWYHMMKKAFNIHLKTWKSQIKNWNKKHRKK